MIDVATILARYKTTRERQIAIDSAGATSGLCLRQTSLNGADLSNLNLLHISISDVDLSNCRCRRTVFPPLSCCSLDASDVRGSYFPRLHDCTLKGTNAGCAVIGARITCCDFGGAILERARFGLNHESIEEHFHSNSFTRANFSSADAAGAYFAGSDFSGAVFSNARLSRANLSATDLRGCDLRGANMAGANLTGARISGEPATHAVARGLGTSENAGLAIAAFAMAMGDAGECRVAWEAEHVGMSRRERVVFTGFGGATQHLTVASFDCSASVMLRLYPWDGIVHDRDIVRAIEHLALDYEDWTVDLESITIESEESRSSMMLEKCARELVGSVFQRHSR